MHFTPVDGDGNILENSTKTGNEREFYTIETKNGNIFYIVADKEKQNNNVYLLNTVDESDLAEFIKSEEEEQPEETPEPVPKVEEVKEEEAIESEAVAAAEEIPKEAEVKKSKTGTYLILFLLAAAGVGGYYYFKILKPKQVPKDAEDLDEFEFEEESEVPGENMMKEVPSGRRDEAPSISKDHPCYGCAYAREYPFIGYCLRDISDNFISQERRGLR